MLSDGFLKKYNLFCFIISFFYFILICSQIKAENAPLNIQKYCEGALEFYLDRPDLETEFKRRLEFLQSNYKRYKSSRI